MHKINPVEKFARFTEHWSPKIVAELNGQHVKLVKAHGSFPWHHHDREDEMFLVVRGSFRMDYRAADGERHEVLHEGELIVVPRGVEHRPVAEHEVWIMLFEPAGTLNTGSAGGAHTVAEPGWV
ncbi:MAG: cupin domain-containing protein [Opitutae bacterium]|nr:cupin domain-containing protein [Opitutae bacterium]